MEQSFNTTFPINALPAAQLAGAGIDELSHSAEIKSRAIRRYYQEVPADLLFFFSDIAIQAEAMGATADFSPRAMPSVSAPAKDLRLPRAGQVPRMKINAEVLRGLGREFPGRHRAAMIYGPFTVAGQVAGEQSVLRGVVERPAEVRALLEKCLTLAMDYARLLLETGAEVLWVSDPLAALLPPENFWEFAGDHLARLFALKGDNNTALHICGDTSQVIGPMLQTGVGGISFDQCLDLLAIEDSVPPEVALIGNLDPVDVLEHASAEEAAQAADELVMGLGALPNFTLSSGCAPPPFAPVANIKAFAESGRRAMAELRPHALALQEISSLVLEGKREAVPALVNQLSGLGAAPMTVLRAGLMRGVRKGSALYEAKLRHLPAVLLIVDAFYQGYDELGSLLQRGGPGGPVVALGTVQGDFHEIGKSLVAIMLEANGIPVLDLGVNVAPEKFVEACRKEGCRVAGLSAFITSARSQLGAVRQAFSAAGLDDVMMVAGGAAVNRHLALQAGANGYAKDAVAAVRLIRGLLKKRV
jgi:MtaA/CmuA family methyltransferase